MNDQLGQVCENFEKLGYIKGRNYLSGALLQDYLTETNEDVKKYIDNFLKLHSDTSVEIR